MLNIFFIREPFAVMRFQVFWKTFGDLVSVLCQEVHRREIPGIALTGILPLPKIFFCQSATRPPKKEEGDKHFQALV